MMRKFIEQMRNVGLRYFSEEFYPDYIMRDNALDALYCNLLKVDDNGLFLPILARQATIHYKAIRFFETNKTIQEEFENLTKHLIWLATRAKSDSGPRSITGTYIKVAFIRALPVDTERHIEDELARIRKYIDNGIETIYILALGSKIPAAKEIAERAYQMDARYAFEPVRTNYKKTFADGRRLNGVCIELSVIKHERDDEM